MPTLDEAILQVLDSRDSAENTPIEAETSTEETSEVEVEESETTEDESTDVDKADDDDDEGEGGDAEAVELSEDQLVTIDGKTASVKDLLMRQADYTRKTQELARKTEEVEERAAEVEQTYAQMKEWYESRVADPISWVGEIAEATGDYDAFFAALTKSWADEGLLSEELLSVFGLTKPENPVVRKADTSAADKRLADLEARIAEREEREAQEARQQEIYAEYERQVQNIIGGEGLSFADEDALQQFRIDLFSFAKDNSLTDNLEVAYAVMARQREKAEKDQQRLLAERAAKKRKTQVVSAKSGAAKDAVSTPTKVKSYEDAAAVALAKLESEGRL
jgi:hypothetical protein